MAEGTVIDVVDKAIGLAQLDLSFRPLARGYLNTILKNYSSNTNWPSYRLVQDDELFLSGQKEYDLPEDYSRSDDCYLVYNNSGTPQRASQILIVSPTRFRQMANTASSGVPRLAYIDLNGRKIVFESAPTNGTYSYSLAYFRQALNYDVNGGDDDDVLDFENPETIIQELAAWLMKYTDDERQPMQGQASKSSLRDTKINSFDEDDDSVTELATSKFRGGSRPPRGGGGGGWWMGD